MKETNEILSATARLLNAVAETLEKANYPNADVTPGPVVCRPSAEAVAAAEDAEKRTRVRKAKPGDKTPTAQAAAPTPTAGTGVISQEGFAIGGMTEDESKAELQKIAKTYVERFGNKQDGIKAFRDLMVSTTKIQRFDDLTHAHRLQLLTVAKAEIAKADASKPAAAAATNGVEV